MKLRLRKPKNLLERFRKKKIKKFQAQKALVIALVIVALALLVVKSLNYFVVAIVNGRPISRIWLDRELEKQAGKTVLENQVTKLLVFQEAKKQKVKIIPSEIEETIEILKNQVKAQGGDFEALLSLQNITQKELEEQIRLQLIIEKILGKEIEISEEEMRTYFEENQDFFPEEATFETSKEAVKEALFQQKINQKAPEWIEGLKEKAKIYYLLKL